MKFKKNLGVFAKYIPLLSFLCIYSISLFRSATTITNETARAVQIWTDALLINAIIGMLGSFFVLDKLSKFMMGRAQSLFADFNKLDSKELAVTYNGVFVGAVGIIILSVLITLYLITDIHLFFTCANILAFLSVLATVASIMVLYLQNKQVGSKSIVSKFANPIILPFVIWLLLLLISNNKTVGFIYQRIQTSQSSLILILSLIVVLCYALAVAFCHFSNLYCLLAFVFVSKDQVRVQAKLDAVQKKTEKLKDDLRQIVSCVDKTAEKAVFLKKVGLLVYLVCSHIKCYCQEKVHAVVYLMSFVYLKITQLLGGLLEPDRIRINGIRFCEITIVLELLVLDMLLFLYLGSDDTCSRFFEVLSTVIIIPILLSSLASLKTNKEKQ